MVLATLCGCYEGLGATSDESGTGTTTGTGAEEETDDLPPDSEDDVVDPGPAVSARRLSRFEYNNTVADLLGDLDGEADQFPPVEKLTGFDTDAGSQTVSRLLAELQFAAARNIAQRATADVAALLGCEPAATGADPCVEDFVDSFGARAYRRPLRPDERERLWARYQVWRDEADPQIGTQLLLEYILQTPQFLYRLELDAGEGAGELNAVALGPYEIASRLSYFLWGSMPDDELFEAAANDNLGTPEAIAAQASRMLDAPRAREMVAHFHDQWLGLEGADQLIKDEDQFPEFNPEIAALLHDETRRFIQSVVLDDDGSLANLLTASHTFMNGPLAEYYGVEGVTGPEFQRVELPAEQRSGLLTHGSIMAVHAKQHRTDAIARGVLIRERLLCEHLPPPPDGVDGSDPGGLPPNPTARQLLEAHQAAPSCAGCHILIDGIGLGFENYDASGRWHDMAGGGPVDAAGEVVGSDVPGPFDGAAQLADRLAASDQVRKCVAQQWFRFAQGRVEDPRDLQTFERLLAPYEDQAFGIRDLLVAMTQTDAFRYRSGS